MRIQQRKERKELPMRFKGIRKEYMRMFLGGRSNQMLLSTSFSNLGLENISSNIILSPFCVSPDSNLNPYSVSIVVLPPKLSLSPARQDVRKTHFTIQTLLLRTRMVSPVPYFSLKLRAGNNLHLPNSSTAWKCFSLPFCLFVCYTWDPRGGPRCQICPTVTASL